MATLRSLTDDGWEQLGELTLGGTLVVGDPVSLTAPPSARCWVSATARPGIWSVFARPWRRDPDQLEEIVIVYRDALKGFYELYDEAVHLGSVDLPRRRLVVLDGMLRSDHALLEALSTVEEMPWMLERGLVTGAIGENPAQIAAPRAPQAALFTFGLGPAPAQGVNTTPFSHDASGDED